MSASTARSNIDIAEGALARVRRLTTQLCTAAAAELPEIVLAYGLDDVLCTVIRRQGRIRLSVSGIVAEQPALEMPLRAAIAHEIGHITRGHLDHSYAFCVVRLMFADLVHLLRLDRINPYWRYEFEADLAAVELVGKDAMISLLSECRKAYLLRGRPDSGSLEHPSYSARIALLETL